MEINGRTLSPHVSKHKGFFFFLKDIASVHTLVFRVQLWQNCFNTKVHMVLSPIAEAETVEGLFDVLVGLGTFTRADTEDVALRDVLLQLSLAEDHSAFGSLRPRTCQQDVGCMASTLQQRG